MIKFKTIFENQSGQKAACLASIDDAWKRNASFDRPALTRDFNRISRGICSAAQWWDLAENMQWPIEKTQRMLRELVAIAEREKLDRIILPVAEKSPAGKFIKKQMREVGGYALSVVELHEESYYVSRQHHFGRQDGRRKTGLDFALVYRKDM